MTILVTGATGHVGGALLGQLDGARALTRDPASAKLPAGTDVVAGDLLDPGSLASALDGVDAVFLLWPSFSTAGTAEAVAAIAGQVKRVVYLSALNAADEPDSVWATVERLVEQSGVAWTHLRASGFAKNTLAWRDEIRTGVVRFAYGGAGRSLIHEADIAAVAAAALTTGGHDGQRYVLTGPDVVTQADQVRIIGEAIGRPVRWDEQPRDEARAAMVAEWADPALVDGMFAYFASLVDSPEPVTDTVEAVTGKPARTFAQWAADHAADFR